MSSSLITTKEEWDARAADFYPYFLEYLKSKGTSVDAIEVYAPETYQELLERVNSLPARYDYEGVKKTVRVPIGTLALEANAAAVEAREATAEAVSATATALESAAEAQKAARAANEAHDGLEEIKAEAIKATEAANNAANEANAAAIDAKEKTELFAQQEELREEAFKTAISQFSEDLTELKDFYAIARQAWEEFIAEYEHKALEYDEAEQARKMAESERALAEAKRVAANSSALAEVNTATGRLNTLCDNPPKIQDGTWWIYDEKTSAYVDTGVDALGHSPYIDPNTLTWMVWDDKTSQYVDSGVLAVAEKYIDITDEVFEDMYSQIDN